MSHSSNTQQNNVELQNLEKQRARDDAPPFRHHPSPTSAPPTLSAELNLIKENEFLRAELSKLKMELRAQQPHQKPSSPRSRNSTEAISLLSPSKSWEQASVLSPSRNRQQALMSSPKPPPYRKINRHPSDSPHEGSETSACAVEEDLDKHESARGLKNRKHVSPPRNNHRRKLPSSALPIHGNLPLTDASNEHCDYDSERASFLKAEEVSVTPETAPMSIDDSTSPSHDDSHPLHSFWSSVQERAGWLVGLLVLQSMSTFIISRNEQLLQKHLVIVRFLTMLVGAGTYSSVYHYLFDSSIVPLTSFYFLRW